MLWEGTSSSTARGPVFNPRFGPENFFAISSAFLPCTELNSCLIFKATLHHPKINLAHKYLLDRYLGRLNHGFWTALNVNIQHVSKAKLRSHRIKPDLYQRSHSLILRTNSSPPHGVKLTWAANTNEAVLCMQTHAAVCQQLLLLIPARTGKHRC